jgi:hypothetical protein
MRVNMWGWRLADDTGAWRGETPTRFGAFEAARREMAGADV